MIQRPSLMACNSLGCGPGLLKTVSTFPIFQEGAAARAIEAPRNSLRCMWGFCFNDGGDLLLSSDVRTAPQNRRKMPLTMRAFLAWRRASGFNCNMSNRIVISLGLASCHAQPLRSLKTVSVPEIPGLETYLRVRGALILRALTADRVRYERASFDHPELCVPAGSPESRPGLLIAAQNQQFPHSSMEGWIGLAPVGEAGQAAPLQTFEELLQGIGSGGGRTNAMNEVCTAPLP
jgi:hypothetical protein